MNYDSDALARMYDSAGALQAKQIGNQYKLGKEEIKARLKIAAQSSKDTRYGIEMERDAARERVEQARAEMERIGIPQMEINRFVAESNAEIAKAELGLKREIFLEESGLKRAQLAKDVREMEEVGIPRVDIERYVAQSQATGYVPQLGATRGQLTAQQEARLGQIQARDAQLKAAGQPGIGAESPASEQEMYQLLDMQSGLAQNPETGTGPGAPGGAGQQRTLEGQELDRRYGLDVAKFGAELASTPDTYFQARRFQGVDVPRLMGGAGAATSEPMGGPTPGVATMGAYLSGQDPYGQAGAGGGPYPSYLDPRQRAQFDAMPPDQRAQYLAQGTDSGGENMRYALGTPYGGSKAAPTGGIYNPATDPTPGGGAWAQGGGAGMEAGPYQAGPAGVGVGQGNENLGMPGTGYDDRYKQVQQIAKTSPPSPYDGLNESDTATLRLMESIYKKGGQSVAGGEYERLGASGRLGYMKSAGRLLGYDPAEFEATYKAYRPAQGDARLA